MSRLGHKDYLVSDSDVAMLNKLRDIIHDAQVEDIDHLFAHIKAKHDIFVTSDRHFSDHKERLKTEFGITVLQPEAAVQFIREVIASQA